MRDIPVGNGRLLINFDAAYQIRDICYPHVGQENHTEGHPFRFGIWVDGSFSWIFEDEWTREIGFETDQLITRVRLENASLGISIECRDMVAGREDVFLRQVTIRNMAGIDRQLRVFLHHDFRIYENKVGDTAYYDPETKAIIHYKKHRYFLIDTLPGFDEFATGRKAFRHLEGTWRDAEDGRLGGGAITEGSVDSTVGVHGRLPPDGEFEFYYWIAAGTTRHEVTAIDRQVKRSGPQAYFAECRAQWTEWLSRSTADLDDLPGQVASLYRRSLLIALTQVDDGGAVIAATDHDVTDRATDHYSYLWPRDAAFIVNSFDLAGYPEIARQFFSLCARIVDDGGYFLQKYNPDGSVGSGWHPFWDTWRRQEILPIQEDETALVIWAIGRHYELYRDEKLIRDLYEQLIVKCADFLARYRDAETGLPLPSWNLWENARGVHTFTSSTVAAGLDSAAGLARALADDERDRRYSAAAKEIIDGMARHLYSKRHGRFLRALSVDEDGGLSEDPTVDASLFALFYFGCFAPDDQRVAATMAAIEERLSVGGGVARFENDDYMRVEAASAANPWLICTLWLAEYFIAVARSAGDLERPLQMLEWVTRAALPSGVLAEQIDPFSGRPVSVSPLTWSHSTFVATVHSYLRKRSVLLP